MTELRCCSESCAAKLRVESALSPNRLSAAVRCARWSWRLGLDGIEYLCARCTREAA